jgi:hypothetical protein
MAFIKFIPYGDKSPRDIWTTHEREVQIWQELTMLRHISGPEAIYARDATAPYIDQAKIYFLDAAASKWRSAGLLYYYSFLNLAKAYLITNRVVTGKSIKSTNIYHGLTSAPQNNQTISNFKIEVHPPLSNNKRNIFALFYQKLTGEQWPFNSGITVSISDIVSYCDDISHEIHSFYGIGKSNVDTLSLVRLANNNWWFEMLCYNNKVPIIQNEIGHCITNTVNHGTMTDLDKQDWFAAHNINNSGLQNQSLIQINKVAFDNTNQDTQYATVINNTISHFTGHVLPQPSFNFNLNESWHFVPKITLHGTTLKWHPLLSNYLFAFMLSSVLRYQPHLFSTDSKDAFLAEAWCNQSASTSLRYFLAELTRQNIRVN